MSRKIQLIDDTPEHYFKQPNPAEGIPLNAVNVTIDRSLAILNGLIWFGRAGEDDFKEEFTGLNHREVVACLDQVMGNLEMVYTMINGKEVRNG